MSRFLDPLMSPRFGAASAEAMSVSDIDEHADSARIWATILEIREEHRQTLDALEGNSSGQGSIDVLEAQHAFDVFVSGGFKQKDLDELKIALWKDT